MSSKSQKMDEIEETDEFITFSTRMISYIIENKNKVLLWAGIVCGLILTVTFSHQYLESKENKASAMRNSALANYEKINNNENKDASDTIAALETLNQEFGGTVAGKLALLNAADLSYSSEKYDKAESFYQEALKEFSDHDALSQLAISGLAYTYLKQDKKDEAVVYFEKVLANPVKAKHAEALYNLSLIYEQKNEKEKSSEASNRILSEYQNSTYYLLVKEKTGV